MEGFIQSVYPNYSSLSIRDKLKINDYFVTINPNISSWHGRFNPKDFDDHEFNYRVDSGKSVIIPNSDTLQQVLTDKSRTLSYHYHNKIFKHWNLE